MGLPSLLKRALYHCRRAVDFIEAVQTRIDPNLPTYSRGQFLTPRFHRAAQFQLMKTKSSAHSIFPGREEYSLDEVVDLATKIIASCEAENVDIGSDTSRHAYHAFHQQHLAEAYRFRGGARLYKSEKTIDGVIKIVDWELAQMGSMDYLRAAQYTLTDDPYKAMVLYRGLEAAVSIGNIKVSVVDTLYEAARLAENAAVPVFGSLPLKGKNRVQNALRKAREIGLSGDALLPPITTGSWDRADEATKRMRDWRTKEGDLGMVG
ncbi:hypothetical protein HDV00_005818 [Rhizophlyctis rosea]|nr:hypothetical protein HDV00_005818 [Rhizophlyctis rosea]